ncbi:NAD-dependent epimerase/dehydratase [Thermovibrio ammonificans HB-1]|uniref:NAD-dependent epimerase/dehydratase n=1 Tax=Thermovibrio ammonificans (strain DSM 15698 / JCM 12110 / HB-1) TaxID=648996 RepID=E8T353_THEA1|nr:GDP-mannose 4,6-dehydratase [Thermovibrio ammonificans]ADU96058.1 NAD-dependent epimerase/dehydratase [Thermovibrio ammonificans HB-1]
MRSVLLTGAAGFIGYRTAKLLLEKGYKVIGVDNLNNYYDPKLKEYRLNLLKENRNFKFYRLDIENFEALKVVFEENSFEGIINLAARAGVRYSIENPFVYETTNSLGTLNLLELMKEFGLKKFVLASTSSLYAGQPMPFKEDLPVNTPISPYAASKKAAEVMSYTYHYLYGFDVTVVRYFTVYGPAGRPDMSIFRFIKWIDEGRPVEVYGDGTQSRDFTYVDDIAEGTIRAYETETGYQIINLGGNRPHQLKEVIRLIEEYLGKKAEIIYKPFHKADLKATWADITKAREILGWEPKVPLEEGLRRTVEWHKENRDFLREITLP